MLTRRGSSGLAEFVKIDREGGRVDGDDFEDI
jgi:hypothetical protein